jgi:hypothetical protein
MLTIAPAAAGRTIVRVPPATSAVVSWNTRAPSGRIELTIYRADGQVSRWLPYVAFAPGSRRSLCGADDVARIVTDIVESTIPIVAIEVRSDAALDAIAISTPVHRRSSPPATVRASLDVPALSQYLVTHPRERGWCSPTSLAMLLAFWGKPHDIREIVREVYDERYGGTGNWAFNIAFAGRVGLRAALVHLAGLDHAAAFIAAGIPLALSFSWGRGDLPGAALDHSDGHLAVLRGFTRHGHPQFNDPAQADIATTYDRNALERVWQAHGGAAFATVPLERGSELVRLAND